MLQTNDIYTPHGFIAQYKYSGATGAIAAGMAANGELFQFRWSDSSGKLAVIEKIIITGMRATTAFAVGAIDIKATIARSWTASGAGGTALSFANDISKLRKSLAQSAVGDARIATIAALSAGTKTLDSQDVGQIITHSSAGVGAATPIVGSIYLPKTELFKADAPNGEHPIVLAQNEGIVVRATVPATGVWNIGVEIVWSEVNNI